MKACLQWINSSVPEKINFYNDAGLSGWIEPDLLFDLHGWCDCLFKDRRGIFTSSVSCPWMLQGAQPEAPANQVWILHEWDQLLGSTCPQGRCVTQQGEPKGCGQIHPATDLYQDPTLLGLVGHYWLFIKGFAHIVQPLHEHLSGAGASKKNKDVTLMEDALGSFEELKKACLETPVLTFADFNKPFLLETDMSKLGLGAVLSQKQTDGWYHLVVYMTCSLTVHECNYHSNKQEFLVLMLKWAITQSSSKNTCSGSHLLSRLTTTCSLISWPHPV